MNMKTLKNILIIILINALYSGNILSQCSAPYPNTYSACSGKSVQLTAITNNSIGVTGHKWYTTPTGSSYIGGVIVGSTYPGPYITTYTSSFNANTKYYVASVCGTSESSRAAIVVNVTPSVTPSVSITTNPAINGSDAGGPRLTVCSGTSVTFTANPTNGGTSPTYQWKKDGNAISGATSSILPSTLITDGESYSVNMVSNTTCLTTTTATGSLNITVLPILTPSVKISPVNPTICAGNSITFTATPTNGGIPSYVWKVNGVVQSGQTGTSFSSTSITNGQVVTVEMTATNKCQTVSLVTASSGTITVKPNVSVSISGVSSLCNGLGGSFKAMLLNGDMQNTYLWLLNNNAVVNPTGIPDLYVPGSALNNGDKISCQVTSNALCATGPITSNVITVTKVNPVTPAITITSNPNYSTDANGPYLTICNGTSVTFNASGQINGGNNPTYKWLSNGSPIAGQTGVSYTTSNLVNGQKISVQMTSNASCLTTNVATSYNIRMIVPPPVGTPNTIAISQGVEPTCQLTNGTTTTRYNTTATNSTGYNWSIDNAAAGSINATGLVTWTNGFFGNVTISVTANGCSGPSPQVSKLVTVMQNTTVSISISGNNALCNGLGGEFRASLTNPGPHTTYQWLLNNNPVINPTGIPELFDPSTALNNGDNISCQLTTDATCAINNTPVSNLITITNVNPVTPAINITSNPNYSTDANGPYLTICNGTDITFTASNPVNGGSNPTYQWYSSIRGSIPGATGLTYTTSSLANGENISVNMTSNASCLTTQYATSYNIRSNVDNQIPGITISSNLVSTLSNTSNVTFNATATNTGILPSYQWKLNGSLIATNVTSYSKNSWINGDQISCTIIRNEGCLATSNILAFAVSPLFSQNQNFIVSNTVLKKGVLDVPSVYALSNSDLQQSISYFDGLGRPLQNISTAASPNGNDIIQPIAYNQFGLEDTKYLPYIDLTNNGYYRPNALVTTAYTSSDQYKFYQNSFGNDVNVAIDANPYSRTIFENSPLNRVMEQGAPGTTWQPTDQTGSSSGHTNKLNYLSNADGEVRLFAVSGNSKNCVSNGSYAANTLYKTITKNENWKSTDVNLNTIEEFKDLQGKVILKRSYVFDVITSLTVAVETYYVYDDCGLLRYVIPPDAISQVGASITPSDPMVKNLCYYYEYDSCHRTSIKQLPGADQVYMVYDNRDRLVLTQDGNLRAQGAKWLFTKYDKFNRPVLTGIYTHGAVVDQPTMQSYLDNTVYPANTTRSYYVTPDATKTASQGYTDVSFPASTDGVSGTISYLTANYYDNYNFPGPQAFDAANTISGYSDNEGSSTSYFEGLINKVTGTKTNVLGTSTYLTNTNYYDDKYRVIQSRKSLYDLGSGIETMSSQYDFTGRVLHTKQLQTFGITTTSVDKYMTYDQAGRLKQLQQQLSGDAAGLVTISQQTYNEIGELIDKKLHVGQQSLDYWYNIRGWLTSINNPDNLANDGTGDAYADLFAEKLLYNDNSMISNLTPQAQFNGNICGIIINRPIGSSSGTTESAYGFTYDALNRLNAATYAEGTNGMFKTNLDLYDEFGIRYDKNGNIQTLQRNSAGILIDNLSYTYMNNNLSNQLQAVTDASNNTAGSTDVAGTTDYLYDKNGNLTQDANRSITGISYNVLNLPNIVTKDANNGVTYTYSASGEKLVTAVKTNGTTNSRYYAGEFEYDNSKAFSLMRMEEGIINKGYKYEYQLKDHLGNVRVTFSPGTSGPTLDQRTDYYPFGMVSNQYVSSTSGNNYLYNGKEAQKSLTGIEWDDYGKRFYDPQIGRFTTVDPFTEKIQMLAPYQYASNNPVWCIDLDGLEGYSSYNDDYGNLVLAQSTCWKPSVADKIAIANSISQNCGVPSVSNTGTLSPSPNPYEQHVNSTIPEWEQNCLRNDNTLSAISAGTFTAGLAVTGIETAPFLYETAGYGTHLMLTTEAGQYISGIALGAIGFKNDWPANIKLPTEIQQNFMDCIGLGLEVLKRSIIFSTPNKTNEQQQNSKQQQSTGQQKTNNGQHACQRLKRNFNPFGYEHENPSDDHYKPYKLVLSINPE